MILTYIYSDYFVLNSMKNNLEHGYLTKIANSYRGKNEGFIIKGPFILNHGKYWVIHYVKKGLFKKIRGISLIILDSDNNIVKDREKYEKIAQTYLTPKINEEFIKVYEQETIAFREILSKLTDKYPIDEKLFRDGRESVKKNIEKFDEELISISRDIENLSRVFEDLIKHKSETISFLTELPQSHDFKDLKFFADEVVRKEFNIVSKIDNKLSTIFRKIILFQMMLPDFKLDSDIYKNIMKSLSSYIDHIKILKKDVHSIFKEMESRMKLIDERVSKIDIYYMEMLKRIG